jgi:hypothetical protein
LVDSIPVLLCREEVLLVDRASRIFFPLTFFLFVIVFWHVFDDPIPIKKFQK